MIDWKDNYKALRFNMPSVGARAAKQWAKELAAGGKRIYSNANKGWGNSAWGNNADMVWIENPEYAGLRFVGYADEIANIRHTGWFIDEYQSEKYRGVVYQLPARNGHALFLAGYEDPCNDGAAALCLDIIPSDYARYYRYDGDAIYLARDAGAGSIADSIAERYADDARDYNSAYHAGSEHYNKQIEVSEQGAAARESIALIRDALALCNKAQGVEGARVLCGKVIRKAWDDIVQARDVRASLLQDMASLADGDAENHYFYTGKQALRDTFNDGAQAEILSPI